MNITPKYNERLIQFAKHLLEIEAHPKQGQTKSLIFQCFQGNFSLQYEILIPIWLTEEVYKAFPKYWQFDEEAQEHFLVGIEEGAPPESGIFDFFALSDNEFAHVFDISGGGMQSMERFGGKKLKHNSGPQQIAANIVDLVAFRLNQIKLN